MLEALTISGAAAGLAAGASIAAGKLRDVFRRRRFSEDVGDLATEFNTALRDAVVDALEQDDREYQFDTATDWPPIADQLDEIDVVFEDERDAIVQIADAVGDQLDGWR